MVTPLGSRAKEDKAKTKRRKRGLCKARQAKIGSLIEDSSWSVSHRGWAELACSDFMLMHANINGGLLSDPMLRSSLGSGGVGGWKEERSERLGIYDGWAISFSFFFLQLLSAPLCFWSCIMRVYVFACTSLLVSLLYVGLLWSWLILASLHKPTRRHNRRLKTSNAGNNSSYFIDLVRKRQRSLDVPQGAVWLEVTSLLLASFPDN